MNSKVLLSEKSESLSPAPSLCYNLGMTIGYNFKRRFSLGATFEYALLSSNINLNLMGTPDAYNSEFETSRFSTMSQIGSSFALLSHFRHYFALKSPKMGWYFSGEIGVRGYTTYDFFEYTLSVVPSNINSPVFRANLDTATRIVPKFAYGAQLGLVRRAGRERVFTAAIKFSADVRPSIAIDWATSLQAVNENGRALFQRMSVGLEFSYSISRF